ncbi:MAG TPA: NADH-quinone oxidoreductase subunit M, partial [Gammaproteobacteria bacterium]
WVVVILTLGVLISAAYAVRTIGRLFTGPVHCDMNRIPDLKNSEMLTASVLTLGFLAIGFFPAPTLDLITASVQELSLSFTGM